MTNVLLISESYIKENSILNDNAYGKSLKPAIVEAQDIGLQMIVGECLYKKLLDLVRTNDIQKSENVMYKDLLDNYIQPFLLYSVLSNCVLTLNAKIGNIGTVITKDEYVVNLTQGEMDLLKTEFTHKADFYTKRIQAELLNNKSAFPEIEQCSCGCYSVKPNLKSSSSCNVWLGGFMGK